ncbi:MAG: ribokinase [Lachnospiraceae bacterium]|nr:ribokinase [Lachnospiraceae bacterium]
MKRIVVIGSLNMDLVAKVDHIAQPGETILASDFEKVPGGKGANQAYGIGKLGGSVSMLGMVGRDDDGIALLNNLSGVGVNTADIRICDNAPTGTALIAVDSEGRNSITVIPGTNKMVDAAYIDKHRAVLEEADIVILQLEIPLETVMYAAHLAKSMGKYVILDPAPAIPDLPKEIYRNVDLIKPNETELGILTGTSLEDTDYLKKIGILHRQGASDVVVSLGADGVILSRREGDDKQICGRSVRAVDTTAAGDSFLSGLAVKLAEGQDMEDAIDYAQRVASIAVTRKGAQPSIPTAEEVDRTF